MAEASGPQRKDFLRRMEKKVLVHDRRTVEIRHGLPNPQRFEYCNIWLPKCNSIRTGREAHPEVWFRILHDAPDGRAVATGPPYREQTVEIALGPKGAFGKGPVGALTRRVAAQRIVSAAPSSRGDPRPPKKPKTPRVVELLRKAIEWQTLLESGKASNQAAIARREGITRARVTQVMGLLRLSPEIQQHILSMPAASRASVITERALRPIAQLGDPKDQTAWFQELVKWPR